MIQPAFIVWASRIPSVKPQGVWEPRVPAATSESHFWLTPSSGSVCLSTNNQHTETFIKGRVSWDVWSDHTAHNGVQWDGRYWWWTDSGWRRTRRVKPIWRTRVQIRGRRRWRTRCLRRAGTNEGKNPWAGMRDELESGVLSSGLFVQRHKKFRITHSTLPQCFNVTSVGWISKKECVLMVAIHSNHTGFVWPQSRKRLKWWAFLLSKSITWSDSTVSLIKSSSSNKLGHCTGETLLPKGWLVFLGKR